MFFSFYPGLYFLFKNGGQDCPNFRFASIEKNWD